MQLFRPVLGNGYHGEERDEGGGGHRGQGWVVGDALKWKEEPLPVLGTDDGKTLVESYFNLSSLV